MGRILILILFLSDGAICFGQPVVAAVLDGANFGPRVAPGSLASVFGSKLAAAETQASTTPLPTSLGGTSVTINGTAAPLLYVNSTQINFQVPAKTTAGQASIIVKNSNGTSATFFFLVTAQAPGFFQDTSNHVVAQNSDSSHSVNSKTAPAVAGSVITAYLTGLGPLDNAVADGTPAPSSPLSKATQTATATVNGVSAPIQFLGLTPGFIGLGQANIQIPTLPTGDYPLVITIGGYLSASAIVSVSGTGTYTAPLVLSGAASFQNNGSSTVALLGNVAYVCNANRITMVDVSNATAPAVLGEFGDAELNGNGTICVINSTVTSPYLVDLIGPMNSNTSYVSFGVWDLTRPAAPVRVALVATQIPYVVSLSFNGPYGFSTTSYFSYSLGNRAITNQNGDFLVWNFTNPALPSYLVVAQPATATLKQASAVINAFTAYVATSSAAGSSTTGLGAINVVNIASPLSPVVTGQLTLPNSAIAQSFDVSGNVLLVSGNTTLNRNPGNPNFDFTGNLTLSTVDITSSQAPVVLSSFDTGVSANGTFHTAAFANGVFAVANNAPASDDGGPGSVMIVDARSPRSPVLYPFQTQFGVSGMLATSGGYLLASNIHGLSVFQLKLQ